MQKLNNRHCQRTRLWNGKEEETSLKVLQHRLASLKDTTETCLRLRLTEIRIGAATRQTRAWHAGIGHFTRSQWEVTIHMGLPGEIHLDQEGAQKLPTLLQQPYKSQDCLEKPQKYSGSIECHFKEEWSSFCTCMCPSNCNSIALCYCSI